jgi:agmatine deiminase
MPSASDQKWYQLAETAPQQCVLMAYPNSTSDNSGNLLEDGQNEIISIANAIAQFEPVILFSNSETLEKAKTRAHSNVSVDCVKQTSHLWIRDFGPIFVRSHDVNLLQGVDFNFNYWGGKCAPSGDEHIAELATKHIIGRPALSAAIVAEGGGMEVDGEGTFMAAESAIVNDNRNLGKT